MSSKDNVKLVKLLEEGFKRPAYWNEYQTKIETNRKIENSNIRRLFVLAFNNTTVTVPDNPVNNNNNRVLRNSRTKYFLPRVHITNYNVLIVEETFMINQLMTW